MYQQSFSSLKKIRINLLAVARHLFYILIILIIFINKFVLARKKGEIKTYQHFNSEIEFVFFLNSNWDTDLFKSFIRIDSNILNDIT